MHMHVHKHMRMKGAHISEASGSTAVVGRQLHVRTVDCEQGVWSRALALCAKYCTFYTSSINTTNTHFVTKKSPKVTIWHASLTLPSCPPSPPAPPAPPAPPLRKAYSAEKKVRSFSGLAPKSAPSAQTKQQKATHKSEKPALGQHPCIVARAPPLTRACSARG